MTTEATHELDEHRAIVREIHGQFARAYGFGGTAVLVGVAAVFAVAWWFGALLSPITWVLAVTVGLVTLFGVRSVVYRRADELAERLQSYCEANDIDPGRLREHFGDDDLYPFFDALFEVRERRAEIESS